jgi:hypothetical protein
MKTQEYVRKYKLNESDKFDTSEFVADLTNDFIGLIEWFKLKSAFQYPHFQECVKQIRQKWDSINNKTAGELPERLWNCFYITVIDESERELFPEIAEKIHEVKMMSYAKLKKFLSERDIWLPEYGFMGKYDDRNYSIIDKHGNPVLEFAYEEAKSRKAERDRLEEEELKREHAEWQKRQRARMGEDHDWFNFFLGSLLRSSNIPSSDFDVLGLPTTATEEEVKGMYRKLSLKHHPDRGGKQEDFITITNSKNKCLAYIASKK